MKIVTYNLHFGGIGPGTVLDLLTADLLLVQESGRPRQSGQGQWLWSAVQGNKWGSGLFLRTGALTPLPLGVYPGWVVAAQADGVVWPGGAASPLRILNVHAPTQKGRKYVAALHDILDDVVPRHGQHGWLIGGDFNLHTFGPEHFKPSDRRAEQEVIDRLENELGLASAWEMQHGKGAWAQTLRWSGDQSIPFHCDFLFVPRQWQEHLRWCEVKAGPDWTCLNDHNPVVADFG